MRSRLVPKLRLGNQVVFWCLASSRGESTCSHRRQTVECGSLHGLATVATALAWFPISSMGTRRILAMAWLYSCSRAGPIPFCFPVALDDAPGQLSVTPQWRVFRYSFRSGGQKPQGVGRFEGASARMGRPARHAFVGWIGVRADIDFGRIQQWFR